MCVRCNNSSRYDIQLGAINVAADFKLEYEAQDGMHTHLVRSMVRVCSFELQPQTRSQN